MNVPALPRSRLSRRLVNHLSTQFIPDPPINCGEPAPFFNAMISLKLYSILVLASHVTSMAYEHEWKLFGGLAGGSMFGALVVILQAVLDSGRRPMAVFTLRFVVNHICGVGVGALVLWAVLQFTTWPPRPLLVGGIGFLCGVGGMRFTRILERRLEEKLSTNIPPDLPPNPRVITDRPRQSPSGTHPSPHSTAPTTRLDPPS